MHQLQTEDLLIVLRALHFYEDKLTNTVDDHRNPYEWDHVIWLRRELADKLKLAAYIK